LLSFANPRSGWSPGRPPIPNLLVAVERLQPSSNATRLHISGGKSRTVDGPFTESNELIAGVNILEVASKEEAIAWMKRCPTCQGDDVEAQFEIRAVLEP
jgi:hypothetical protein